MMSLIRFAPISQSYAAAFGPLLLAVTASTLVLGCASNPVSSLTASTNSSQSTLASEVRHAFEAKPAGHGKAVATQLRKRDARSKYTDLRGDPEVRERIHEELSGLAIDSLTHEPSLSALSPHAFGIGLNQAAQATPAVATETKAIHDEESNSKAENSPEGQSRPGLAAIAQDTHAEAASEAVLESHKLKPALPLFANQTKKSKRGLAAVATDSADSALIFDIPVTYNTRVSHWIKYFQTSGRTSFKTYLERSARYLPFLQFELANAGLPQDLAYIVMVESGFRPSATSQRGAKGMWQFIDSTARQYGLHVEWWLDERRDFFKSTRAAISYITDLYRQFNSWYLVAASYNMGENGVRRLINQHHTNNFWTLAERGALPNETRDYVPKILAAMLISKAPGLYGFRDLDYQMPLSFEYTAVPGGTDLINLAKFLGVSHKYLLELNPELIKGFVPRHIAHHNIRVPKGATMNVAQFIRLQRSASVRQPAASLYSAAAD